jgi:hypothetical protein
MRDLKSIYNNILLVDNFRATTAHPANRPDKGIHPEDTVKGKPYSRIPPTHSPDPVPNLMLLPLQGLPQQREQTRWGHDADLSRQRLGDGAAALLFRLTLLVGLARVEVTGRGER